MTKIAPNFILFITDQHRADYLGCYGHPILRTPHIDSIAARGTMFRKFYVASPVCMPNRASLMTGRMPAVHGVRTNGIPLPQDAVTFVDLLRDAGYDTALIGKSHLQNFTSTPAMSYPAPPREGYRQPSPGLRQALRIDLTGQRYRQEAPAYWQEPGAHIATPFYGYGHVEVVTGHGDAVGGDYRAWLRAKDPAALSLLGPENSAPHDYVVPQAYRTRIPEELYSTNYLAERAQAWLAARKKNDAPFFLTVSFPDPHHPFNPPGKYWDMYKPEQFPVPEAFRRNDWTPPPLVQQALDERESGKANLHGMRSIGTSAREAQEAQALTCGMIACIDDAIGRVLQALEASGASEDTVVIFTTDHGDHLGDHRLLLKGCEQYQSILHVPFIWSDPQAPASAATDAIGSTIDIPATILDRAVIAPYVGMQGKSLLPCMGTGGKPVRDCAFVQYEHQMDDKDVDHMPRWHTIVDQRYRMTVMSDSGLGELYDLAADPGEFDNLWDKPEHATLKARLMERLVQLEIEHTDTVPYPTGRA
ncbi:sulfatase [Pseudorhodoplanes sp.]|uniref:sulfatase family protein n=1 Tax=Pseudorhodoplanes sp. TaxID=1934341 RepID=UPI003918F4C1